MSSRVFDFLNEALHRTTRPIRWLKGETSSNGIYNDGTYRDGTPKPAKPDLELAPTNNNPNNKNFWSNVQLHVPADDTSGKDYRELCEKINDVNNNITQQELTAYNDGEEDAVYELRNSPAYKEQIAKLTSDTFQLTSMINDPLHAIKLKTHGDDDDLIDENVNKLNRLLRYLNEHELMNAYNHAFGARGKGEKGDFFRRRKDVYANHVKFNPEARQMLGTICVNYTWENRGVHAFEPSFVNKEPLLGTDGQPMILTLDEIHAAAVEFKKTDSGLKCYPKPPKLTVKLSNDHMKQQWVKALQKVDAEKKERLKKELNPGLDIGGNPEKPQTQAEKDEALKKASAPSPTATDPAQQLPPHMMPGAGK